MRQLPRPTIPVTTESVRLHTRIEPVYDHKYCHNNHTRRVQREPVNKVPQVAPPLRVVKSVTPTTHVTTMKPISVLPDQTLPKIFVRQTGPNSEPVRQIVMPKGEANDNEARILERKRQREEESVTFKVTLGNVEGIDQQSLHQQTPTSINPLLQLNQLSHNTSNFKCDQRIYRKKPKLQT